MKIRTYKKSDVTIIRDIFYSNCPKYFQESDIEYLDDFLEHYADSHFKVCLIKNEIAGCGGYYTDHLNRKYGIAWVMFNRHSLGTSILKVSDQFFEYINEQINAEGFPYDTIINTTQLMEKIFNRYGFKTEKRIPNGYGPNLDHCIMRLKRNKEGL